MDVYRRLLLSAFLISSAKNWAAEYCSVVGIDEDGYNLDCKDSLRARSGTEALPTFSDAFNFNPSTLPTGATKMVFEAIYSHKPRSVAGSDYHVGTVKGFDHLGLGATTSPDNTFYDTSLVKNISPTQYTVEKESLLPTYNLGFALDPWNRVALISKFFPQLGYSSRINKSRGTIGHIVGATTGFSILSLGMSYLAEPETANVPLENTLSLYSGFSLNLLSLDFSFHETHYSYHGLNLQGKSQVIFANMSLRVRKFIATGAYKVIRNMDTSADNLWMMSLQWNIASHLRLLGLYNYVPGAQSIGLQWVL